MENTKMMCVNEQHGDSFPGFVYYRTLSSGFDSFSCNTYFNY